MLVTIIYNTNFNSNVDSLVDDLKQEWVECKVNKLGVTDSLMGAKYQVQFDGNIIYTGQTPGDNTTIINSIKERL
jgi:hypothetical protein|tara:strand:+ start:268 stop:492 length:225 start_codon:yes stop_codon:yes gene_type:complete